MYCRKCGKNIKDNSKFCEFCGHELIKEVSTVEAPLENLKTDFSFTRNKKRIKRKKIYILFGIIAVLIVVGDVLINNIGPSKRDIKIQISKYEKFDEMDNPLEIVSYKEKESRKDGELLKILIIDIVAKNKFVEYGNSYEVYVGKVQGKWKCIDVKTYYGGDDNSTNNKYINSLIEFDENYVKENIESNLAEIIGEKIEEKDEIATLEVQEINTENKTNENLFQDKYIYFDMYVKGEWEYHYTGELYYTLEKDSGWTLFDSQIYIEELITDN